MNAITNLVDVVPLVFVMVVFTNRYVFGLFLRRTAAARLASENLGFQPKITVIVPLFNEGEVIGQTIRALLDQTYAKELLSIVVVDDCSTDDSYQWALRAARREPRVRVLRNPANVGKRQSIIHAVRATDAEIVVSVDSDAVLAPDALARLIAKFTEPKIAAVGGRVLVLNAGDNWLTRMQAVKYYFGYEYLKNLENAFFNVMCLSGCLTAYRREVLLDLEPVLKSRSLCGVPIKYGEDRFLTRQIIKSGYKTRLTLDAVCFTKVPDTASKLFSQQLRWRRSNLVDFFGGLSHGWRMPPFVALHYFTLPCLLLVYPGFLFAAVLAGSLPTLIALHLGLLALFAGIYWHGSRSLPAHTRVNPLNFLTLAILMPVTYVVITVLALFTLDSDSWETRQTSSQSAPVNGRPARSPALATSTGN